MLSSLFAKGVIFFNTEFLLIVGNLYRGIFCIIEIFISFNSAEVLLKKFKKSQH